MKKILIVIISAAMLGLVTYIISESSRQKKYLQAAPPDISYEFIETVGCLSYEWENCEERIFANLKRTIRSKKYDEFESALRKHNEGAANVFDSMKGNFSVKEMGIIKKGLEDGKLTEGELPPYLLAKIKVTRNYRNLILQKYW